MGLTTSTTVSDLQRPQSSSRLSKTGHMATAHLAAAQNPSIHLVHFWRSGPRAHGRRGLRTRNHWGQLHHVCHRPMADAHPKPLCAACPMAKAGAPKLAATGALLPFGDSCWTGHSGGGHVLHSYGSLYCATGLARICQPPDRRQFGCDLLHDSPVSGHCHQRPRQLLARCRRRTSGQRFDSTVF